MKREDTKSDEAGFSLQDVSSIIYTHYVAGGVGVNENRSHSRISEHNEKRPDGATSWSALVHLTSLIPSADCTAFCIARFHMCSRSSPGRNH